MHRHSLLLLRGGSTVLTWNRGINRTNYGPRSILPILSRHFMRSSGSASAQQAQRAIRCFAMAGKYFPRKETQRFLNFLVCWVPIILLHVVPLSAAARAQMLRWVEEAGCWSACSVNICYNHSSRIQRLRYRPPLFILPRQFDCQLTEHSLDLAT